MNYFPDEVRRPHSSEIHGATYGEVAQSKSARQRLLEDAIKITTSDRNKSYGNPEDNFANIAAYWTGYWFARNKHNSMDKFDANDVTQMMILMKMARLATNPTHHDSTLDVAGYAACHADIQESMVKRKEATNQYEIPTLANTK